MTQFEKWFKAQFGGLPLSEKKRTKLLEEKWALEEKLNKINSELERKETLNYFFTAAQYTRFAAKKNFEF